MFTEEDLGLKSKYLPCRSHFFLFPWPLQLNLFARMSNNFSFFNYTYLVDVLLRKRNVLLNGFSWLVFLSGISINRHVLFRTICLFRNCFFKWNFVCDKDWHFVRLYFNVTLTVLKILWKMLFNEENLNGRTWLILPETFLFDVWGKHGKNSLLSLLSVKNLKH